MFSQRYFYDCLFAYCVQFPEMLTMLPALGSHCIWNLKSNRHLTPPSLLRPQSSSMAHQHASAPCLVSYQGRSCIKTKLIKQQIILTLHLKFRGLTLALVHCLFLKQPLLIMSFESTLNNSWMTPEQYQHWFWQ